MNIIGRRNIFYAISGSLMIVSVILISLWGLRFGIDFTGGSLLELEFQAERPDVASLKARTGSWDGPSLVFTPSGDKGLLVRTGHLSEEAKKKLLTLIGGKDGGTIEKRFTGIGPTIGQELRQRSITAILLVISLIVLYVAWAFRKVSRPVKSWKYGVVTIITLLHDAIIPTGFFALLGKLYMAEVDTLFVTALLTIIGFSVHDTIVVFDRIRENLKEAKKAESFEEIVNKSVNETMARSINTSLTVLLSLLAVFFFGGESVMFFSLALIVGIIFGTYSSIFIASPLLVSWQRWADKPTRAKS